MVIRPGGDDQRVVGDLVAVLQDNDLALGVDVDHLTRQKAGVLLILKRRAQRRSDVLGR